MLINFLKRMLGIPEQDQITETEGAEKPSEKPPPGLTSPLEKAETEAIISRTNDFKPLIEPSKPSIRGKKRKPSPIEPHKPPAKETLAKPQKEIKPKFTEEREIVIGLDFGTSCTKLVIQDTVLQEAYAVPFNVREFVPERFSMPISNQPDYQIYNRPNHLLPSRVYCDGRGSFSLRPTKHEFYNLKTNLLDELQGNESKLKIGSRACSHKDIAVAFITLSLREARNWFYQVKQRIYKNIKIIWQMNMGVPAGSFESKYTQHFREIALAAWNLSLGDESITVEKIEHERNIAAQSLSRTSDAQVAKNRIHPDFVNIIPEILAEVYGCYIRTPLREDGMYLLIDVGAHTLDISTFMIFRKDHEDRYPILSASVHPLGVYNLHKARTTYLASIFKDERKFQERLKQMELYLDGLLPIPKVQSYTPESATGTQEIDEKYKSFCTDEIWTIVHHTHHKRNRYAKEWDAGLPVLLCGGGSKLRLYKEAVEDVAAKLQFRHNGFRFVEMPKPRNLELLDIPGFDYHRIAAAFGLSYLYDDYGTIKSKDHVVDIMPVQKEYDVAGAYIDKELT